MCAKRGPRAYASFALTVWPGMGKKDVVLGATIRWRGCLFPVSLGLSLAFATLLMSVACGGIDQEPPEQTPVGQTAEGVWEGTLRPEREGDEISLCLQIIRAETATTSVRISGALYLDGEFGGIVAGALDPDGAITFGGGSEVGTFTGTVEDDSAFGTWTRNAPDIVPAGGGWSAEKTDRETCE